MSETMTFTIDGKEIQAAPGQTILEAAQAAGVSVPDLLVVPGVEGAHGRSQA